MNTYYVEQRAEIWVRTTVQANNAKDALEIGKEKIDDGNFVENPESFELMDDYWIGAEDPNLAVALNKDGSITEIRIKE